MSFQRVYPIEIWMQGKKHAVSNLEEYLKQDKPDIVITDVKEIEGLIDRDISFYRITGYSTNPQPRQ